MANYPVKIIMVLIFTGNGGPSLTTPCSLTLGKNLINLNIIVVLLFITLRRRRKIPRKLKERVPQSQIPFVRCLFRHECRSRINLYAVFHHLNFLVLQVAKKPYCILRKKGIRNPGQYLRERKCLFSRLFSP